MPYTAGQMVVQMKEATGQFTQRAICSKNEPTFADNTSIHQNYRHVTTNLADPHVSFMVVPNICGMGVYSETIPSG
jgi:hypothetical protein